jgi:hypothetical protein
MYRRRLPVLGFLLLASLSGLPAADAAPPSAYAELVELFEDLREFQETTAADGIRRYAPADVAAQYAGLQEVQQRLAALDIEDWPVWQQVDYHLVRAEMNALEFHHRVYRPWARDPGFYSILAGDAGVAMESGGFARRLLNAEAPLAGDEARRLQVTLRALPDVYAQARTNLTEAAADLADLAIRNNQREIDIYTEVAERMRADHPQLADDALAAAAALTDYSQWLEESKHWMTAPAGVGKDNYSWWMRNVQLSPWGWEENNAIIQREYDRQITFLKLEENRNRDLPALDVAMTHEEFETNLLEALHHVVDFLREEEIMTVPDWVDPADYTGFSSVAELRENIAVDAGRPAADFLPENTSIDTKVRQREILPGETHEYIGHMLDGQRQERLTRSPIRSADRRFNMASMRLEGWAVALEELLMQAGVLDDRPRKGREMEYLMNASHMSLAIPDMLMSANEIGLTEARHLCAAIMPRGWSRPDEGMVWFEMQSNLRNPGGFHSNVVTGKAYFMKLFREQAQALGDDFVIRDFVDAFLAAGLVPMSLIRWEMTGNSDDVTLVTESFPTL